MISISRILTWLLLLLLASPSWAEESVLGNPADQVPTTIDAATLFNQGTAAYKSKDYDLALQFAEQLINQAPDDHRGYWLRGESRVRKSKDYEGAIADLEQVNRLAPDFPSAWGNRGWYLILLGRFDEARRASEKAHKLDPASYFWAVNLGHTYLLQGDRETAHGLYRTAIPMIPNEAALNSGPLTVFNLFIEGGWMVEAAKEERSWFAQAWADWQEVEALYQKANKFYDEGLYQEAIPLAEEGVRRSRPILGDAHPKVAIRIYMLALLLHHTARYAEAEPLYREALALRQNALPADHPDIARSINNLAALLDTTGRYAEAEPLYREALVLRQKALSAGHPDIAASLNNLAALLKTTGRYAEAEPLFREALAINRKALPAGHPSIATDLNNLAELLNTTGRYDEAEPLYREALAIDRKALPAGHPSIALSLNNLAGLLDTTGRYDEAEPLYREALALRQNALPADHPDIARSLNNLALLLNTTGRYDEAEPLLREALAIDRKALPAGHPSIALSLNNLAGLLYTTGRYDEAEPLYREALVLYRKALPAGHPSIARSLNNLAALLYTTGRYAEAEPLYREALVLRQKALSAGHPDIARSLNNLAALLNTTGRYAEAEPLFREALAINRKALPAGHPSIATDLNNLAALLDTTARYDEAEPLYREALAIDRKALPAGHPSIATDLNNLAELLNTTGRYDEAEPLFREALVLYRKALSAGHPDIATSLDDLAALLQATGRYAEAEPLYREALVLRQKALPAGHPDIATSLDSVASLLETTGRYAEAEPIYREALVLRKKNLPAGHPGIGASLNNLALLLHHTARYAEAEPLYREALAIDRKALPAGHPSIALSLNNLAGLLDTTGRYDEAEPLFREALAINRKALPAGHPGIGASLNNLAELLNTTGRYDEAEPLYYEALAIANEGGEPETLWVIQGNLSYFHKQQQQVLAIFFGKQAINTLQSVRRHLQSSERTTQQAFLKSKEDYYKNLADLLIEAGRIPEAQQVLTMLKEEEYFDFIRRDAGADAGQSQADYTAFEQQQVDSYAQVSRPLTELGQELLALEQIKVIVRTAEQQARIATLRAQLEEAHRAYIAALDDIERAFAQISQGKRHEELALKQIDTDQRTLVAELGTKSGAGVVLIHYLVLEDTLHILVTTPRVQVAHQVAVEAGTLNKEIQALSSALQNPGTDARPAAKVLYDRLIAPIAEDLAGADAHTLMLSLDGALRYLPFAALYDGERYLTERYALSVYTAAARDKLKDDPAPEWYLAGFGVSQAHPPFSPLPAVPKELEGIVNRGGEDDDGILQGTIHLDQTFTLPALSSSLADGYPVLHVASHFTFKPGTEKDSFLLLGDGSYLDLGELRKGDYNFGAVDLLALSACQTAMGGQDAQGQEIEGLGALAQKKGAKGVLATLWSVADTSTGSFMAEFYRLREADDLTKAEALRQTQLAFISGAIKPGERGGAGTKRSVGCLTCDTTEEQATLVATDYRHPYYWAPFILMGNWL